MIKSDDMCVLITDSGVVLSTGTWNQCVSLREAILKSACFGIGLLSDCEAVKEGEEPTHDIHVKEVRCPHCAED